ncbi:hypothetical protein EYB26_000856 [Talaromyces marneffei]|uniref:uncharacterized protein n=1 Tax=Talaromyces marneffei TaxID=37727 RepID=UPI0012A7CE37|nr:uncharacterized protein EYB26_000856 [Talaromyces marneffei]QGA13209.1 hypothetical protein EYB26_000856 [Talaromyces marneffei]
MLTMSTKGDMFALVARALSFRNIDFALRSSRIQLLRTPFSIFMWEVCNGLTGPARSRFYAREPAIRVPGLKYLA